MEKFINEYNILGLENNSSIEEIEKAFKIAKNAWSLDKYAPEELKNRCQIQLDKIKNAYNILINNLQEKTTLENFYKKPVHQNVESNEEYLKFKVNIKNTAFNNLKICYWWRLLYMSIILFILDLLFFLYPK